MTVYITCGTPRQFTDGTDTYYAPEDVVNSVTGGLGVTAIRIINNSTTDIGEVDWQSGSTTYDFVDVPYSTNSAEGVDAVFNVSATVNGYVVTVVSGGSAYAVSEQFTMLGTDLGGTTTANDLAFAVTAVDDNGAITEISAITGSPQWPQTYEGSTYVLPQGEAFVQTQTAGAQGLYILGTVATASMYIQPVSIVG